MTITFQGGDWFYYSIYNEYCHVREVLDRAGVKYIRYFDTDNEENLVLYNLDDNVLYVFGETFDLRACKSKLEVRKEIRKIIKNLADDFKTFDEYDNKNI